MNNPNDDENHNNISRLQIIVDHLIDLAQDADGGNAQEPLSFRLARVLYENNIPASSSNLKRVWSTYRAQTGNPERLHCVHCSMSYTLNGLGRHLRRNRDHRCSPGSKETLRQTILEYPDRPEIPNINGQPTFQDLRNDFDNNHNHDQGFVDLMITYNATCMVMRTDAQMLRQRRRRR